jgi:hypothetical protein
MKSFLAVMSFLMMGLVAYAGGIVTAFLFLNPGPLQTSAPPQGLAPVWTTEPIEVDRAAQDLERLPARPVPQPLEPRRSVPQRSFTVEGDMEEANELGIVVRAEPLTDTTTTAALLQGPYTSEVTEPDPPIQAARAPDPVPATTTAHVQWCSQRYRSYRPQDNSYTTYSGGARQCVSPYSGAAAGVEGEYEHETLSATLSTDRPSSGGYPSSQHLQSCFDRYRSYRPEDNTYQPNDGGPRRQCQ